jgi:hypothetical protein
MKTKTLEERSGKEVYDQVMKYLKDQEAKALADKKAIPHPLNFMLSTHEEQQAEMHAVELHNSRCEATAGVYNDVAYVMHNSYIEAPQKAQDVIDLNRFGSGI